MKINHNVKIIGANVILVPYEPDHVVKYHLWMENEEIRRFENLFTAKPFILILD